ncbi:MAG: PD-(D/E)XK nuclease family protein, partial [Oscillospiraceae bacterium]|nr:PD-(D/E)XK nuclease family protein [Oscillospiraceae bacterium]
IGKVGNNTITKEEFTLLQKTANRVIKNISKEIMQGNIDIKPTYNLKTKEATCKYCTYNSICKFNSKTHTYAYIGNKPKDTILKELKAMNE